MSLLGSFSQSGVMTMARGRNGDLYGVNGVGRGFRWDGITASVEQLGISPPETPPTIAFTEGAPQYYVQAIDVIDPGFGYAKEPTVTVQSPSSGVTAKAKAELLNATIRRVPMLAYGTGYSSCPAVTLSAPDAPVANGTGALFSVTLGGGVDTTRMLAMGSGYTTEPTVTVASPCTGDASTDVITCQNHGMVNGDRVRFASLSGGSGLNTSTNYYVVSATDDTFQVSATSGGTAVNFTTALSAGGVFVPPGGGLGAHLYAHYDPQTGRVRELIIADPGDGYASPPAIYIDPPIAGTQARARATVALGVTDVAVTSGGTGYRGIPRLRFTSSTGGGAIAECIVSGSAIASVNVLASGSYRTTPAVTVEPDPRLGNRPALVRPVLTPGICGRYWCAYRYVDDTSPPVPSSISELTPIEVSSPCEQLTWSNLSAGSEARVAKIELWRTSADQALTLYRVATIPANTTSYVDSLSDADLTNPERTLPCTGSAATDVITCTNHGMADGSRVRFASLSGGSGLSMTTSYYVVNATATTFQVSLTSGGPAVNFTSAMTGLVVTDSFQSMAIVLPNGQPNARRFRPPPQNKSTVVMFQDRAWYAVDVSGRSYGGASVATANEPNTLYFSEIDEPESVPEANELILQDNVNGADKVTALMPYAGAMIVFQHRHCYRLSYASQPIVDASISLIGQRGCFNQRCFVLHEGMAYVADESGIYVLDGTGVSPISEAVSTFWRDGIIHFGSSDRFFVMADPATGIVRFHFSIQAGIPDRALCYHPLTKAWWVEVYGQAFGASCVARTGGRQRILGGAASGSLVLLDSGGSDTKQDGTTAAIACQYRTGSYPFESSGNDRRVRVIYKPTSADASLEVRLYFNNAPTPRPAAVFTDRGSGFTTTPDGPAALNMSASRSALGAATGYAGCHYAGKLDDWSSGGDRHLALGFIVSRPTSEAAILYGVSVEGVSA